MLLVLWTLFVSLTYVQWEVNQRQQDPQSTIDCPMTRPVPLWINLRMLGEAAFRLLEFSVFCKVYF